MSGLKEMSTLSSTALSSTARAYATRVLESYVMPETALNPEIHVSLETLHVLADTQSVDVLYVPRNTLPAFSDVTRTTPGSTCHWFSSHGVFSAYSTPNTSGGGTSKSLHSALGHG